MTRLFPLIGHYLWFHRGKTAILTVCLTTALYAPLAVHWLVGVLQTEMVQRAGSTPVVIGAAGSRFDLTLHALYFRADYPGTLPQSTANQAAARHPGPVVPLFLRHRARGFPVVGTTLDYFDFRNLAMAQGDRPVRLGDVVIGWEVARQLGLGAGDRLRTDPTAVFDLAGGYPLDMRVTGVLARSRSPDDRAVFVDLHTAWLIEGIGHGHDDLEAPGREELLLERGDRHVVGSAAVETHIRVTDENLDSFHFHGDPEDFPLTAVLVDPVDARARALLLGDFVREDGPLQAVRPAEVIDELLGMVIRLKRFFDVHHAFLLGVTALFVALVMLLSLRLRTAERRTMAHLGCARGTVFVLLAGELILLLAVSAVLAFAAARVTVLVARGWLQTLTG